VRTNWISGYFSGKNFSTERVNKVTGIKIEGSCLEARKVIGFLLE